MCFSPLAHLPLTGACPPQERKKLLSFVIVGGGPTGVEVAAELHDLITEDLVKLYPEEVGPVVQRAQPLNGMQLSGLKSIWQDHAAARRMPALRARF